MGDGLGAGEFISVGRRGLIGRLCKFRFDLWERTATDHASVRRACAFLDTICAVARDWRCTRMLPGIPGLKNAAQISIGDQ
jgi:hypothetical protein